MKRWRGGLQGTQGGAGHDERGRVGHLWWQDGRQNVGAPRPFGFGERLRLLASDGFYFLSEIRRKDIY